MNTYSFLLFGPYWHISGHTIDCTNGPKNHLSLQLSLNGAASPPLHPFKFFYGVSKVENLIDNIIYILSIKQKNKRYCNVIILIKKKVYNADNEFHHINHTIFINFQKRYIPSNAPFIMNTQNPIIRYHITLISTKTNSEN